MVEDNTVRGQNVLSEEVVTQIAGFAAREVEGVHRLGKTSIMNRITGSKSYSAGIGAEVGNEEVALDLEIVLEYGFPLQQVADSLRKTISNRIKQMLDRTVVELNIKLVDIHFPDEEKEKKKDSPRVK